MKIRPLKFEELTNNHFVFTNDAGDYFVSNKSFLDRLATDSPTTSDIEFLEKHGHISDTNLSLREIAFQKRWYDRLNLNSSMSYIIVVPTLRCNLACEYCQVSRAAENAKGFDWTDETFNSFVRYIQGLPSDTIKVEFQGGEPTLRLDLLHKIRSVCRDHFANAEFVVCTNLQNIKDETWDFLSANDTFISTSLDSHAEIHLEQRTKSSAVQSEFENNLKKAIQLFGSEKVSALPTLDPQKLPDPVKLMTEFRGYGFTSVYLRRINYQGFARKSFRNSFDDQAWFDYFDRFVNALVDWNWDKSDALEEYYLAHIIRRIVKGRHHGHVDLRNPNWVASDYIVVDFDGRLYPSDEARMVTRLRQMDLSVGDLESGLDYEKIDLLNLNVSNVDDPDCRDCAFQPYCGLDMVDDISRYSRVDLPRLSTYHCKWHKVVFKKAFNMLYSEDPKVQHSVALWLSTPVLSKHLSPVNQ